MYSRVHKFILLWFDYVVVIMTSSLTSFFIVFLNFLNFQKGRYDKIPVHGFQGNNFVLMHRYTVLIQFI